MCRAAAAADQRMLPSSSYHQTSYELLLSSILCAEHTSRPTPNLFDGTHNATLHAHGIYFVLDMLEILSYLCILSIGIVSILVLSCGAITQNELYSCT